MNRPGFAERWRYRLGRLGTAGFLGAALALFAAALELAAGRPLDARLADTQAAIAALRARAGAAPAPVDIATMQLARFHAAFPPPGAIADMLTTLNTAAAARGLAIRNAEYRDQIDAASGLRRYQVTLPFKGAYPQIRAWLADTLNAHPSAVLEDIQMKREGIAAREVEARVRLSFYVAAR